MKYLLLTSSALFLLCACQGQSPARELRFGGKQVVILLDSVQAAEAITTDHYDHYFDLVTASEMSIQMRKSLEPGDSRDDLLPRYIAFLKSDVSSFTDQEAAFVGEVVERVHRNCMELSPALLPDTLRFIKTKGTHYGDGVWYTRGNCIVVPANELESRKTNPFTTTTYHEVFHVVSRTRKAKSKVLYQLIGFEGIGLSSLRLPQPLAERVLYNPDGVDFAQKISLQTEGGERVEAIPIIYSKVVGHQPGQDAFFSYVEFNLYQIKPAEAGQWQVVTQDDGFTSTLSVDKLPDFFRQIRDNTGYIIHPDEVLADNFSFIMAARKNPAMHAKFSKEGKQLLNDMEAILSSKQ